MGKCKNMTLFEESLYRNSATYGMYLEQLSEIAMSMFKWENLPDSIDERFLELTLFVDGQAIFFYDDTLGHLALQNSMSGGFNVYRVPLRRRAYAVNGYNRRLTIEDSVIIYNNFLRTNSVLRVIEFARRLSDLDRTIDVNANAQKTPVLITCDESQRLTMANLYKEYNGNVPFIFGDKKLDINGIKVLKTDAPYVADKLYDLKSKIWNEALTYLGISNVSIQKKERLVSDEVNRNQGGTIACRKSRLKARQQACEKINKMFNLDIWCEYDEDGINELLSESEAEKDTESEVDENE